MMMLVASQPELHGKSQCKGGFDTKDVVHLLQLHCQGFIMEVPKSIEDNTSLLNIYSAQSPVTHSSSVKESYVALYYIIVATHIILLTVALPTTN